MSHNPYVPYDASYVGLFYAFEGLGGFDMEQGLQNITLIPIEQINKYDVTDSVQILYDVRLFNEKLGLYKDYQNINIISTSFDPLTLKFPYDSITITADEFVSNVDANEVLSVGKLQTLYSDFILYVNDYFGYSNGFSTLFNISSQIDINNGVFDSDAFIYIINGKTLDPNTGEYVNDLSGSVIINNINNLLNNVTYNDPFNNRGPNGNNGNGYDIQYGFIEGDLIFIPTGVTVTLNVDVNNNNITLNSLGAAHLSQLNASCNYTNGYFSSVTTTTNTNIKRVIKAPLLLKLINIS